MKKVLKISLVVGIVLIAINVYGVDDSAYHKKKPQSKLVTFGLIDKNNIDVSVYDANNELLHTENVNSNGKLIRTYNLDSLAEGVYYLAEESKTKITKYEILVTSDSATIMSIPLSEVYK